MKISQLQRLVRHMWNIGTGYDPTEGYPSFLSRKERTYMPILIWGEAGIGKSEAIHQAADKLNIETEARLGQDVDEYHPEFVHVIDLRLGTLEVPDLIGIPNEEFVYPDPEMAKLGYKGRLYSKYRLIERMINAYPDKYEGLDPDAVWEIVEAEVHKYAPDRIKKKMIYSDPDWFPEEGTRGFLFLDEVNRSQPDVRQAVFQLILDRKIHDKKLPNDWVIVSAVNPDTEDYQVEDIADKAFMDRFCHIPLIPDTDEWLLYANEVAVEASIRSLIAGAPSFLGNSSIRFGTEIPLAQPSPRTWVKLSQIMRGLDKDLLRSVAVGMIGDNAWRAWEAVMNSPEVPMSGDEVFSNYGVLGTGPDGRPTIETNETREKMLRWIKLHQRDMIVVTMSQGVSDYLRRLKNDEINLTEVEALRLSWLIIDLMEGGEMGFAWDFLSQQGSSNAPFTAKNMNAATRSNPRFRDVLVKARKSVDPSWSSNNPGPKDSVFGAFEEDQSLFSMAAFATI